MQVHIGLVERARLAMESIDYLADESKRDTRKEFMAKRYKIDKYAKVLKDNGHPNQLSKRMGAFLAAADEEGAEPAIQQAAFMTVQSEGAHDDGDEAVARVVFPTVLVLGDSEGAPSNAMVGFMDHAANCLAEHITKKKADMTKAITTKRWKNAMVNFSNFCNGSEPARICGPHLDDRYKLDPGASCFLFAIRTNTWRVGPDAFPTPGFPVLLRAMDLPLAVNIFAISPIVAQGIAINDIANYLDTPSGAAYLREHSGLVLLKPRQTMMIPAGYLPQVTYSTASKEDATANPMAFGLVYTIFSIAEALKIESSVWTAIATYNSAFLDANGKSKVYNSRAILCTRFASAVAAARAEKP